jgi:hypothetical protein
MWPLVRRPGGQLLVLIIMSTGFGIGGTEPPNSHTRVSRLFNEAATPEVYNDLHVCILCLFYIYIVYIPRNICVE